MSTRTPPLASPPAGDAAALHPPPERLVARNFLSLASGEVAARVLAFGATVYAARVLGPEAYGVLGFAAAVVLYLSRIADGGMEYFGLGIREIASDRRRVDTHAPDLVTARFLIAAVLVAILAAAMPFLPRPEGAALTLYGLTLLMVGAGTRWVHLGLERTRLVAIARTAGEALMALLVLATVRSPGDLLRVPLAQFLGDALAALLLLAALHRLGHPLALRLRTARVLPLFRESAPLVASALLGLMIFNSDLIMLRLFRDAAAVGYYAAAYTLISFILNLGVAYSQSLLPTLTRTGREGGDARRLYHTAAAQCFAVGLPIAAGGTLVAPEIIGRVFGDGYADAALALAVLIWSIPLSLIREVATVALMVAARQRDVLRLTGAAAVLNILLNLLLIPRWGIPGAAASTLVTEGVRMAAALAFARAGGFPLPGAARLWRAAVATLAMAGLVIVLRPAVVWIGIAAGALGYALALAMVGGLRFRRGALPLLDV